jgi:hypothetical protein
MPFSALDRRTLVRLVEMVVQHRVQVREVAVAQEGNELAVQLDLARAVCPSGIRSSCEVSGGCSPEGMGLAPNLLQPLSH